MSLKNIQNVRAMAGEGYFQLTGEAYHITLGHTESLNVNHEVSREDIYSAITGVRTLADTDVTEQKATGTAVLRETGARNVAYAVMAQRGDLTQAAESGLTLTGSAVKGSVFDLGRLDVSVVTLTDGTDPLVEGTDYELDAQAGTLTFVTAQTTFDLVYDCAEITAGDDQSVLRAFSAAEGIEGHLMVVQRQPRGGKRFKYTAKVRIYPDGALTLHSDSSDKATVPITFDVIEDASKPEGERFGILQEVKNG
ncbi:hypothetical protein RA2_04077 [Roseovarius sp. A-2]|uniref:phage tail tube protein n=1 Tax=Roseovarius sp. A-2 TaxID=1570360 RepID=UPI0009B51D85|nr:hypothetical protein [Roseovarius sp. A-2]GAW37002.1 hypothetical protein RA2_04077 [Roseovarius sp. A-2]